MKRGNVAVTAALVAAAVLLLLAGLTALHISIAIGPFTFPPNVNPTSEPTTYSISMSGQEITYPSNYEVLANYTLAQVNGDRLAAGVSPVSPSPIASGQEHADSMLANNYFSHWDTQGFKPYMRYTLLGGSGAVEENIAYEVASGPAFVSTGQVESAIASLENQMMNNDSNCCNNGHRLNILDPFHNRISIGIAYDSDHVYLVQDFENAYISFNPATVYDSSSGFVEIVGSTSADQYPSCAAIFWDHLPAPLSSSTLKANYSGDYDLGTFVGNVFSNPSGSCTSYGSSAVSEVADAWYVSNGRVDLRFSLAPFVSKDGAGVYTIYLLHTAADQELTSLSIFIS